MLDGKVTLLDNIDGEIRRQKKTQEALCKALGVERRTYNSWQQKGNLPSNHFLACAKFLNCSLDYLARDVAV